MTTELTEIDGVGPSYAEDLEELGYESAEDVATADVDELDDVIGTASGEELQSNALDEVELSDDDREERSETMQFEPGFTNDQEIHLIYALVNEEVSARSRNNTARLESAQDAINEVRDGEPYNLDLDQLSIAYTATNQLESEYRGKRGLSTFVASIRELKDFFQEARRSNWPEE